MSNYREKRKSFVRARMSRFYMFATSTSPAKVLVMGFLAIILLGTILLSLPIASQDRHSIGFLNALFTSTSAVCVTGLVVVNTLEHWSLFGKVIILMLIQVGGLGFMSMVTATFLIFKRKITLKDRMLIKEAYNQNQLSGMVKLVLNVFKGTLLIEGVSALALAVVFMGEGNGFFNSIWTGIFISVSAFCNAGFDIIGTSSLTPYQHNIVLNIVVMFLIISGGIGFAVWLDLAHIRKVLDKEN